MCAAFVAGPERYARVAAAFDWRGEAAIAQGFRLDAWIDPPAYTGKPPILLDAHAPGRTQKITTPVGSVLVLRAGDDSIDARTEGAPWRRSRPTRGGIAKADRSGRRRAALDDQRRRDAPRHARRRASVDL